MTAPEDAWREVSVTCLTTASDSSATAKVSRTRSTARAIEGKSMSISSANGFGNSLTRLGSVLGAVLWGGGSALSRLEAGSTMRHALGKDARMIHPPPRPLPTCPDCGGILHVIRTERLTS